MEKSAFRSALLGFIVGALLLFFSIIILNQIYLNFQTPLKQVIFGISPFAGGLIGWWINYMISNRKEELYEMEKKIEGKVSKETFDDHIKVEKDLHGQLLDQNNRIEQKVDNLITMMLSKKK